MSERSDAARVKLTLAAMAGMIKFMSGSRKNMFTAGITDTLTTQEASKKGWQKELLTRWVDSEYIAPSREEEGVFILTEFGYGAFSQALADYSSGHGTLVSAMLWPKEPVEIKDKASFSAPIVPTVEASASTDPAVVFLGVLDAMAQRLNINSEDARKYHEQTLKSLTSIKTVLELFSKQLDVIDKKQETWIDRGDKAAGSVNKRLEALDERMTDLMRVVEANQAAVKRTAAGFEDILKSLTDLRTLSEPILTLKSELALFTGRADALLKSNEETRKDRLGKLASRINASIEESALLRDEILNVLSDEETDGAGG